MPRRVMALLLVVAVCAIAGAAIPGEAHALSPGKTGSPWNSLYSGGSSSGYVGKLVNFMRGQSTTQGLQYGTLIGGESTTTKGGVKTMTYRARVAGGFLPRLGLVATRLTLAGTAAYIGWRVYQSFSDGSTQTLDLWLDSASLGKDALANPCAVPTGTGFQAYACGNYKWIDAAFVKESTTGTCTPVGTADCWTVELYACYYWDTGAGGCLGSGTEAFLVGYQATPSITSYQSNKAHRRHLDVDQCAGLLDCYVGQSSGNTIGRRNGIAWLLSRTLENLEGRDYGEAEAVMVPQTHTVAGVPVTSQLIMLPDYALGGNAGVRPEDGTTLGSPNITTNPYNVPSSATSPNTGTIVKILEPFDSPCGRALINHLLEPTIYAWVPGCIETAPTVEPDPATIALPRPMANETYADYILRLQDLGWIGAATLVELDPADDTIGASAVQKLGVTGKPGTWRRALWPSSSPLIGYGTDLTIWHNPSTAPAVPADPTDEDTPTEGGGVLDPGGTCAGPLQADPNFGPLLDLDFGDRFPFGLFAWVASILGAFMVSPDAPNWTFDTEIPATSVTPEYDLDPFTIDLEWLDDYMATFRLLVTFVLWVGAIWYVGSGLLGLRTGSNPADAVDDVL